jgi:transposase
MRIRDARSLPAIAQEDLRKKAVAAVLGGKTQVEVAALFKVTRQIISRWLRAYAQGGAAGLRSRQRGRPKGGMLLPWQAAQTARMIMDRHPEQLKLPFALWTREAVQLLIKRRFGVELSLVTVGRYLARWGFTPQKPVRRAFEQNPELVTKWLNETYPEICKRAKKEGAVIYWGDEMGMRSDHAVGRSYSKRGKTPVIPGTGQRFRCNMISAINNRGGLVFSVFTEGFRFTVFRAFLKRLVRQVKPKVFLIVDGHPVHRSAKIKAWVKGHPSRIELFFLPGYSPELNPDEMLNQDVKSNAVGRKRAVDRDELMQNVRGYLRSTQRQPVIVRNYFHAPQVRYAA